VSRRAPSRAFPCALFPTLSFFLLSSHGLSETVIRTWSTYHSARARARDGDEFVRRARSRSGGDEIWLNAR